MILRTKRRYYILGFLTLLLIEAGIAACLKSGFIRANLGDFLAVIMLYCLLMACSNFLIKTGLLIIIFFCFTVEALQLINLTRFFDAEQQWWANLLFGAHFSWLDLLMYMLGGLLVWGIEKIASSPALLQQKKGA